MTTDPENGTGAHTLAAYVVRVTADCVRMDRVRCDGCAWWSSATGECAEPNVYAGTGYCSIYTPADHACNAWQPKAGQ